MNEFVVTPEDPEAAARQKKDLEAAGVTPDPLPKALPDLAHALDESSLANQFRPVPFFAKMYFAAVPRQF